MSTPITSQSLRSLVDREIKSILLGEVSRSVSQDIDTYFLQDKWQWDKDTVRKSGYTAGSPRDIFDTGELYFSEQESFSFQGDQYTLTREWDTEHAKDVHDGTEKTLARPWTDVIKENHKEEYARLIANRLARAITNS